MDVVVTSRSGTVQNFDTYVPFEESSLATWVTARRRTSMCMMWKMIWHMKKCEK